jgi:uncharacterized protein YfaS (alpha-2-macroglobulin family)
LTFFRASRSLAVRLVSAAAFHLHRLFLMKSLRSLGVLLFLLGTILAAPPPDAELFVEGDELQPSGTVEVRFARAMVAAEQVGVVVKDSPLVFAPALPGQFTWLSTRSGVYAPSSAPQLGTSYRVTLRAGLADAAGSRVGADFARVLTTPPFRVSAGMPPGDKESTISPQPAEQVAFNLKVKLEGAEKFFTFVADDGRKVAASVRHALRKDYFSIPEDAEDWHERRAKAHQPASAEESEDEDDDKFAELPQPNQLIVSPAEPLTPGPLWRLEMRAGIEAQAGGLKVAEPRVSVLGRVTPFTLDKLTAESFVNSGRSLVLDFSENPAPDVSEKTAGKFFRITPAVAKLSYEAGYQTLTIHGDFQRGVDYRLEIDPSLLGESLQALSGERTRTFRFAPVRPRLYLPAITADQLRGGARKFPVHSVNLQSVRVTAHLVAPEHAAQAVEAFAKYAKEGPEDEDAPNEFHQPIPPGLIKATPLAERTLELPGAVLDARQETLINWTDILGGKKAGVIFLTVEGQPLAAAEGGKKRPGGQALIQLTDLGVLWKRADGRLRATVFSMATGQTVEGASVAMLKRDFSAVLASANTNATGEVSLPLKIDIGWLTVRHGEDVHALPMGPQADELPMSRFGIYSSGDWSPDSGDAGKTPISGLLFTDRPLYRPGETVRVKGIVRRMSSAGVKLDSAREGFLAVTYPRDSGTQELKIRVDARGAFDASFELPAAMIGNFQLRAGVNGSKEEEANGEIHGSFKVQEFQPNAFDVRVVAPERFAPEQKVVADLSANYFFGSPVSDARVQWTLEYSPAAFYPSGLGAFSFPGDGTGESKSLTLRGEGRLAATLAIAPQLPQIGSARFRGKLTVEVTDQNQQTVAESREFFREAADFYLGIDQTGGQVLRPAEEFTVRAVAVRPDGTPQPAPVAVKAELVLVEFETVRVQAAGKAVSFHTERREKVVATAAGKTLVPMREGEEWQTPPGETVRFKPEAAGEYLVRLTAQDGAGRTVQAVSSFSVSGYEPVSWDYRNPAQMDLVADKPEYQPGDTARILVKTPISGEAWVSVERGASVLRSHRVKLEGNAPTLEIPLAADDAPNVFVSVVLIRGAEQSTRKFKTADYRYGVCRLRVVNPMTRLSVALTPAQPDVQPGRGIETEVRVLDARGAPVADAEVTFWAVDDGILALTAYERPEPHGIFHRPFSLSVATGLTLFGLLPEDPSDLTFANKGYLIGGGGPGGPASKLRSNFPGTACWMPALRTGKDGRVKAHFTAPDALTRYRLLAVAHAGENRFGSGESAIGIRKPLMLLSGLGPVANVGDEIIARAVVRNETGASGTAEIALELDATAQPVKAPLTAKVSLEKGEARTVDFPVKLVAMGAAEWKWSAHMEVRGAAFDDRMLASLKIGSPVPVLRETYLTELDAKTNDLLAGVNPQLLEGEGAVTVTLANTRLAGLGTSARQLLEYPYGCAEQVVSSLIPWIVVRNLGPVLGDIGKDPKQVRQALEAGVERIFALQTSEGGLAYWPGGQKPGLFVSAWAALALAELAKQDFPLPAGWPKLVEYLGKELRDVAKLRDGGELDLRALTVFALARSGNPEPAYHEKLAARRSEMTREGRALLALAILESKGAPAFAEGLLNPALPAPEDTSWFGSVTRERAVNLMAWTRAKPKSKEVGRLTAELLGSRRGGHWRTTQENAWALLALAQYFALVEREVKPVSGSLVQKGRPAEFQLTKKQFTETIRLDYNAALPPGPLTVENPKRSALFGEARFVARPPVAQQPRQDRGYAVSRSYRKVAADGSLAEAADLQVGDRVVVTLRVATPRPGHFVAIDDPLPAILEAVNSEFRTAQAAAQAQEFWRADYREVRADRVLYFCDHLPAGAYTFSYLARVRTAGTVMAPATKVEEMYRPERFGLSETATLTSSAAK